MLYHFDWKLHDGKSSTTEAFGVTVRRKGDLFLIPIPYNSVYEK